MLTQNQFSYHLYFVEITMQIRELSKDLQAKAETELNEKPEQIESDLEAFKVWLERTPYINARTDDQFLVSFLRGCKFSLERAKAKIDSFYSIRAAIPETYGKRAVTDDIIDLIKLGVFVPVPKTDGPAGNRIIIYRPSFDPDKMDVTYAIRGFGMLMDIMMLEDDNLIVSGTEYIADLSGMKLAHVRGLTPMYLKKIVMAYQDGNPVRIKGIHYVNMPSFFLTIFNLVKAFLSEKLRSRVSTKHLNHFIAINLLY